MKQTIAESNPRPPALWFSNTWKRTASEYPRRRNETLEHWNRDISRIVGGIWWKRYDQKTREKLVKRYDNMKVKPVLSLGTNPIMLPCPACQTQNPVSNSGVYMRCSKCGTNLVSVKVRRKY